MAGENPEPVFDDGSTVYVHAPFEDPPKSDEWVDGHVVVEELSPEEIAAGNALGESIDIDDDEDNGGFD